MQLGSGANADMAGAYFQYGRESWAPGASLSVILTNPYSVTARQLAHVTGCIISMSQAIGSSVYLHTRPCTLPLKLHVASRGI